MTSQTQALPKGLAGLQYPITQVSLVVRNLEATMEQYHRAFGWSGWDVFHHAPPTHHDTELRGERVHYTLNGAEVMVGALNFELLEPLEGPSVWKEFLEKRGEGIASIAVMFQTLDEAQAVKREFLRMGINVTMRASIGDHIEYYYLDTQSTFGCLIESGSGHATDFVKPAYVYPPPNASLIEVRNDLNYEITQISVVVRDLDSKMQAFHKAFGWTPWSVYQSDGVVIMHSCEIDEKPCDFFNVRWAETRVGELNFELIEPLGGDNPWQRMLDRQGEGIGSIAVMFKTHDESDKVRRQFETQGIGVTAVGHIGDHIEWYYLDTEPALKCVIEAGSGHALDFVTPVSVFPQ